jgi:ribosome-binding protein aMBF1 (putative translation factor)
MGYFDPPPLSKAAWIWLREWQQEKGMSDKELASAMKLNIKTLKSYDVSAHTLTIEKLDNLVAYIGIEPLTYIAKNTQRVLQI